MAKTDKLVKSGAWVFARILITNVANVFVVAVLARCLSPSDFGVVAFAMVAFQLLMLLGTEGVSQFVIHDTDTGREDRCQAVFWMDFLFALFSTSVGFLLLPYVSLLCEDPRLSDILAVFLIGAPISSLSRVPDALLRKAFRFKALELRDTATSVGVGVLSVCMVLSDYGVWSLVVPGMMGLVVKLAVVIRLCDWRPARSLHLPLWPRVFSYYGNIVGCASTSFVLTHGDTALIGRVYGTTMVGFYNIAWQAANIVNSLVVKIGNQLALPALAEIGDGPHAVVEKGFVVRRGLRILASLTFPMFVGLFVIADLFILTVYGEKWSQSVTPMRILLIYALRYAMSPAIGAFFFAIARPDVMFRLGLVTVPVYIIAIYIGSRYGLIGVASAVAAVRTGSGMVGFAIAARFMGMSFLMFVRPMLAPLLASLLMGAVLHVCRVFLVPEIMAPGPVSLLALVLIGTVLYLVGLRVCFRGVLEDLCQLVDRLAGNRFGWLVRKMRCGTSS